MAKKAQKTQQSVLASASASQENPKGVSNGRMVLHVKSMKKAKQRSEIAEKVKRPRSAKKPNTKPRTRSKNVDAKKPKKPPTAFFYFLEHFRKEYQAKNPDVKTMRDVGKACGDKWRTMTYEEKVQYYDIAMEKRAEFDRAMADYLKRKESGGDEESEDSEYDD